MGIEPFAAVAAPAGVLFMVFLLIIIAAERPRIYPLVALGVSLAAAGYLTAGTERAFVIWFFIAFAVVSLPVSLVAYAIRWLVWHFGESRGT